jgi:hypothetical protein
VVFAIWPKTTYALCKTTDFILFTAFCSRLFVQTFSIFVQAVFCLTFTDIKEPFTMKTEAIFTLYLLIALFLAPATVAGFVMAATFALSAWCITEGSLLMPMTYPREHGPGCAWGASPWWRWRHELSKLSSLPLVALAGASLAPGA